MVPPVAGTPTAAPYARGARTPLPTTAPEPAVPSPARRPGRALLLAAAALAVLASACQVRVGTDVRVATDGSGRLALTVALDQELADSLAGDGFDPFAGLDELPDGWSVDRSEPDGGQAVTLTADFDDPAGLSDRVAQLRSGLDEEDPLLLEDVQLDVAEDGGATFAAHAGFRPPSSTGFDGGGVAFDGDDLATLLEERGDEVMRVDLRVTLPGHVVDGNADEVDGATATWALPVTELADVRAVGDPPRSRTWWLVGAAAAVGVAVGWIGYGLVRRRGR
jgi:hypothetical protein